MSREVEPRGNDPLAEPAFRARVRRRDPAAWEALYAAYGVRLRRLAHRVLPARLDPEAVAQQAWVRGLHKAKHYDPARAPYPWLSTICVNLCISLLRREGVRRRHEQEVIHAEGGIGLLGRTGGHGESSARVRRGVAALARPLQQIVYLRYACEYAMADVAQLLGISEAAARKRMSRAYEKLRMDLDDLKGLKD